MANVQSYRGISQSLPKASERQSPLVSGALSDGLTMAKGWQRDGNGGGLFWGESCWRPFAVAEGNVWDAVAAYGVIALEA